MRRNGRFFFTSESVTEGHPDKVADQVSDAILDDIISRDTNARVAVETLVKNGLVFVAGEISTTTYSPIEDIVRRVLREIGYDRSELGFDASSCAVITEIVEQSPEIAQGVNREEIGAGDQGMMFGYACRDTEELMPMPIMLAHALARELALARREKRIDYLRPDGKTQVTVEYVDGKPARVDAIVIAAQHEPGIERDRLIGDIKREVISRVVPPEMMDDGTKLFINETGSFVTGGPVADCGLTGRKIMVDTYGGWARHGGGCFSGKDPTKVDRSGAYMARYVAKNIVASGIADECEVQVSYVIGRAEPVSIMVDTFGTGRIPDEDIERIVREVFDFRPGAIIQKLDLLRPIYRKTSVYGHFGRREEEFSWEKTDMVEELRSRAGI